MQVVRVGNWLRVWFSYDELIYKGLQSMSKQYHDVHQLTLRMYWMNVNVNDCACVSVGLPCANRLAND